MKKRRNAGVTVKHAKDIVPDHEQGATVPNLHPLHQEDVVQDQGQTSDMPMKKEGSLATEKVIGTGLLLAKEKIIVTGPRTLTEAGLVIDVLFMTVEIKTGQVDIN